MAMRKKKSPEEELGVHKAIGNNMYIISAGCGWKSQLVVNYDDLVVIYKDIENILLQKQANTMQKETK